MIFSVSVDLDGLGCYAAIHGLPPLEDRWLRVVPETALGRFLELFEALRLPATFFVIGSEAQYYRSLPGPPHEIASHSFAHDYAMSRWPAPEIARDLERCEQALGSKPRGFRAPGYTISPALLDAVRERGYLYDSSLLPSPVYYAAKAAAIGWYALRRRKSVSILGAPGQLFASRRPHLRRGLRELPIATTPLLRAPVIGTTVLALPRLARLAGDFVNLELHAIDLLDASDVPPELAAAQPGLRMPVSGKLRRLRSVLSSLPGEARTLEVAAREMLP
ncbi:MAG: polysaccharide deacetylase family protein [Myxococcales bacterium]|nr:polysaccharide deacetylase family protein [Myxococcales bacterium]